MAVRYFCRNRTRLAIYTAASCLAMQSTTAFCEGRTTLVNYQLLETKLKQIENLNGIRGLLGWDEMVLLAPGSANARIDQKSGLTEIIFEKETSLDLKGLIDVLQASDLTGLPSDFERAVVRDAARDFAITNLKTKDMVVRESELEGLGYQSWVKARKSSTFNDFSPILEKLIDLKREIAITTRPHLEAYDGNIDCFERGMQVVTH